MSAAVVIVAGATAIGAPAAASGPTAASFLGGVVRLLAANRYETAWMSLHPVDQQLVPRELYARCESLDPVPGKLTMLRVARVSADRVTVVPNGPVVDAVAVRFEAEIVGVSFHDRVSAVITAHAVDVGGRWRWILPPERLRHYREPPCS